MAAASTLTVHQALSAVMGDVRAVGKNDRNQVQGFNFRGIDATVNAVGPALRTHGVVVVPEVRDVRFDTVEVGTKRTLMGHALVTVAYTFYGPAGDSLTAVTVGEAMDSGDKAVSKAMSVAFRTCLLQALTLPTSETDPDAESFERSARTLPPERGVTRTKGKPAGDDPWDVPPPVEVKRAQAIEYGKAHYPTPQAFAADFELHAGQGALVASATEDQLDAFLTAVGVTQEPPL